MAKILSVDMDLDEGMCHGPLCPYCKSNHIDCAPHGVTVCTPDNLWWLGPATPTPHGRLSTFPGLVTKMGKGKGSSCRVMTSSKWQNPNIQLVCAESAVKFNIWDVVSVVLSLIIMSSDEIDSLDDF